MLCGISDCFRSLFRSKGQVPHALLTRPPLTQDRSPLSVRLECVRHAASVHPEPGSNSRNILYTVLADYIPVLSSFCSALLLFCKSFIFSLESRVPCTSVYNFLSTFYFVLSLALIYFYMMCCSIFKDQTSLGLPSSVPPFSRTACTLYHLSLLLSSGFLKFF